MQLFNLSFWVWFLQHGCPLELCRAFWLRMCEGTHKKTD